MEPPLIWYDFESKCNRSINFSFFKVQQSKCAFPFQKRYTNKNLSERFQQLSNKTKNSK